MNSILRPALVLSLTAAALAAQAQNLVNNPGFETGSFSGWTTTPSSDGGTSFGLDTQTPHTGTYAAHFGALGASDTISQSIATVVGRSYTVSYYLEAYPLTAAKDAFVASFGGASQTTTLPATLGSYVLKTFTATATSATTTLSFAGRNSNANYVFDDISVTA